MPRALRSLIVAVVAAGALPAIAIAAYTPQNAQTRCVIRLKESCLAQRVPQVRPIKGANGCFIYRGAATRRIGSTWGCPGSPDRIY